MIAAIDEFFRNTLIEFEYIILLLHVVFVAQTVKISYTRFTHKSSKYAPMFLRWSISWFYMLIVMLLNSLFIFIYPSIKSAPNFYSIHASFSLLLKVFETLSVYEFLRVCFNIRAISLYKSKYLPVDLGLKVHVLLMPWVFLPLVFWGVGEYDKFFTVDSAVTIANATGYKPVDVIYKFIEATWFVMMYFLIPGKRQLQALAVKNCSAEDGCVEPASIEINPAHEHIRAVVIVNAAQQLLQGLNMLVFDYSFYPAVWFEWFASMFGTYQIYDFIKKNYKRLFGTSD